MKNAEKYLKKQKSMEGGPRFLPLTFSRSEVCGGRWLVMLALPRGGPNPPSCFHLLPLNLSPCHRAGQFGHSVLLGGRPPKVSQERSSIRMASGSLEGEVPSLIPGSVAVALACRVEAAYPRTPSELHLDGPGRRCYLHLIGKPRPAPPACWCNKPINSVPIWPRD